MKSATVLKFTSKLDFLANQIVEAHEQTEASSKDDAVAYIKSCAQIGEMCESAKKLCGVGQWVKWANDELPFGARQAQKYQKIARQKDVLLKRVGKTNSSIRLSVDGLIGSKTFEYTGADDYYTPIEIIEPVTKLFDGQIDLDPASCERANSVVKAKKIYTVDDDGLSKLWRGNVWINPPFKNILPFVEKLLSEIEAGRVKQACLLLPNWMETEASQMALEGSQAVLFVGGRVKFWQANGQPGRVPHGNFIAYFGRRSKRFKSLLTDQGQVYLS